MMQRRAGLQCLQLSYRGRYFSRSQKNCSCCFSFFYPANQDTGVPFSFVCTQDSKQDHFISLCRIQENSCSWHEGSAESDCSPPFHFASPVQWIVKVFAVYSRYIQRVQVGLSGWALGTCQTWSM